jgi:uncharacterized protein (DUF58 family)
MWQRIIDIWDNTSFYPGRYFFTILIAAAVIFAFSYFLPFLFVVSEFMLIIFLVLVATDSYLLYRKRAIAAHRLVAERLSNGDENKVYLSLQNDYPYKVYCTVLEELPYQLQAVNSKWETGVDAGETKQIEYYLTPKERGVYQFGNINVFVKGPLNVVNRRYRGGEEETVKVYPSYIQMRRYQLMAVADHMQQTGVKRLRRLGHSMEFEQIKEYVRGDDYRTINWKASARRGDLMSNTFTDEKSQQIYCVINKGRIMKMPFDGMTLLDYAINAALVLTGVALQKGDKAGLICFSKTIDAFIPADKKIAQVNTILETLYNQQTDFLEPDLERLFSLVRNRITNRSLMVLFTNYESFESLQRELPFLKRLAKYHLLMVVFFENTELRQLVETPAGTTEEIYVKTIAEKYRYEKQLIVKELQNHGIIALLSTPQNLSINTLNKYLELKNRQSI